MVQLMQKAFQRSPCCPTAGGHTKDFQEGGCSRDKLFRLALKSLQLNPDPERLCQGELSSVSLPC